MIGSVAGITAQQFPTHAYDVSKVRLPLLQPTPVRP